MLWSNELAVSFLRSIYLSFLASCSWERMHIWCLLVKVVGVFFLFFFFLFFFSAHPPPPSFLCSIRPVAIAIIGLFPSLVVFHNPPVCPLFAQADDLEELLAKKYVMFLQQRADNFKILRRKPIPGFDLSFLITDEHLIAMDKAKVGQELRGSGVKSKQKQKKKGLWSPSSCLSSAVSTFFLSFFLYFFSFCSSLL